METNPVEQPILDRMSAKTVFNVGTMIGKEQTSRRGNHNRGTIFEATDESTRCSVS